MEIQNIADLAPGSKLTLCIWNKERSAEGVNIPLQHSMTAREIEWWVMLSSTSGADSLTWSGIWYQ
jgi:hypothetical protein